MKQPINFTDKQVFTNKKIFVIDLYNGKACTLPQEDFAEASNGLIKMETNVATTYRGEEYIVVVMK